jgi:hypothetical protein
VIVGSMDGEVRLIEVGVSRPIWSMSHGIDREARRRFWEWNGSGEAVNCARCSANSEIVTLGFLDARPLLVNIALGKSVPLIGHSHIVNAMGLIPIR